MAVDSPSEVSHRILGWYDRQARALPWRCPPGVPLPLDDPDWPYRVWLSEVMLQQTTVAAVKPYHAAFLARWPRVADLAAASDADVMAAWAGLGYYARARNLLACARAVAQTGFPETEEALRALPGIGAYTAASIAAIAFGKRAVVVDGNVERVLTRLYAITTPMPKARADVRAMADAITPLERAGDFAQGMMDLGATVCTPRNPACILCPLADLCAGRTDPEAYPVKQAKKARPIRSGTAYWLERDGAVWLVRRPGKGLLAGMRALPGCDWTGAEPLPPVAADWRVMGCITHVFTHFTLTLNIHAAHAGKGCALPPGGEWWPKDTLADAGLPSLFAKAAALVLAQQEE